ncbi:MAG TPA: tripartite tricarboxylate transporter permease [Syntrophorhabdales bacterium]|nr:tripartite tricarboxylate transporter permease [Syntrophorhabdales bacterium]
MPINLLYCFIGVFIGTLIGVLPGIGPSATIALLLPATFKINPVSALIMLSGICYGAMYGGSTTSILLNIPGEPSSVVTCLDGYQMARKGRAGPALGISAMGSFIAGTLSLFGLLFMAPTVADLAIRLGPAENFSLMVMGIAIVTFLARGSMVKALLMAAFGLFLGSIGTDPITAKVRFTYHMRDLNDGIALAPVVMGLFGVSEVLSNVGVAIRREIFEGKIKGLYPNKQDWKDSSKPIARGTLIGFFLGALPGVGSIIPQFIAYVVEKKLSKYPEKFGTGVIEGVASPEACNNSAVTSQFIPLLSLGIPSTGYGALLMGALMIYGIQPGPLLIKNNPDLFWGVMASMYVGNVLLLVLNLPLIPLWVRILKIPYSFLYSLILILCVIGSYSYNNNVTDVLVMAVCSVLGYLFKKYRYEGAPLVLALVLGPLLETALRRSLLISKGSFMIFLTHPISAVFLIITAVILIFPMVTIRRIGKGLEAEE